MKRILIVNNNLHIGGVQKALINLLWAIQDKYDVTLALFCGEGSLRNELPPGVRVMKITSAYRFLGMTRDDIRNRPLLYLGRSFFAAITRLFGRDKAISLMALTQKRISGFDVAISYLHDSKDHLFYGGCNDFVLRHVDAPKKVAFLHCDYSAAGADTSANNARYTRFDTIAACSEGCRQAFVRTLPHLEKKCVAVPNFQNYEKIKREARQAPVLFAGDKVKLLTVARLGKEKGVHRAVEALAAVSVNRDSFHYYILGEGTERDHIESLIQHFGLEDQVTLLGESSTPYGYMKQADLLLIPSVSEAAPMVIGESACLGTPILSTMTSSAEDMIRVPGFGWVCDNNVEGLTEALNKLLGDPKKILSKKRNLENEKLDNTEAFAGFAKLVDD